MFVTIGTILLGIAALRAKVFPALTGYLLLAWAILNIVAFITQINLIGPIASTVAYGWIGMMLVQQAGVSGEAAAYQPQTALR